MRIFNNKLNVLKHHTRWVAESGALLMLMMVMVFGLNISIQNTHEIIIKADEQQIFLIPHIFLWVIFSLLLLLASEKMALYIVLNICVFKVGESFYLFFVLCRCCLFQQGLDNKNFSLIPINLAK